MLVFDAALYHNRVPDQPGGGTVNGTNPWGEHRYIEDIELREDGGTPAFLKTIKTALAIGLKEEMGTDKMLAREHELRDRVMQALRRVPGLHLLADPIDDRLGIFSFYVDGLHYNLLVRLLNDRFGIHGAGVRAPGPTDTSCSRSPTTGRIRSPIGLTRATSPTSPAGCASPYIRR